MFAIYRTSSPHRTQMTHSCSSENDLCRREFRLFARSKGLIRSLTPPRQRLRPVAAQQTSAPVPARRDSVPAFRRYSTAVALTGLRALTKAGQDEPNIQRIDQAVAVHIRD